MTKQSNKAVIRIGMIFLIVITMGSTLHSQYRIHLIDSDSVLNCKKIKMHKGFISYTAIGSECTVLNLRNDSVAFVEIKGKHYGPSAKEYFRIRDDLFQNKVLMSGALDACKNYSKYKGAATGTFVTTYFVGGLLGLVPAIATSQTTPKIENLNMPEGKSALDETYRKGYVRQAKDIKSARVWSNYGYGILFAVVTVIAVNIIVGGISTLPGN
ncbi:MAG: hypothetical protein WCL00_13995 [Bacteroidota bacterium]